MQGHGTGELVVIACITAFLVLLPIVIISTRSRNVLSLAALLLCLSSIGVFFLGAVLGGAMMSGLTIMMMIPISGALWFAGLFCALVAWMDFSQDQRAREMTLRLLLNDPRGLGRPEDYKRGLFK